MTEQARPRSRHLVWLAWLSAFLVIELWNYFRHTGNTLSEATWDWFSIWSHGQLWLARWAALTSFMVALGLHLAPTHIKARWLVVFAVPLAACILAFTFGVIR